MFVTVAGVALRNSGVNETPHHNVTHNPLVVAFSYPGVQAPATLHSLEPRYNLGNPNSEVHCRAVTREVAYLATVTQDAEPLCNTNDNNTPIRFTFIRV